MDEPSPRDDLPACLACGACCFSQLPTYVRVTGDDYARLGERAEDLVRFEGHRAFMRMHEGHCAALRIDAIAARFACTVYDERPATCRNLDRGSAACSGERVTKAGRPADALARLVSARTGPHRTDP